MRAQGPLLVLCVLVCLYINYGDSCSCRPCNPTARGFTDIDLVEESRTIHLLFPCCPSCTGTGDVSMAVNDKCGIKKAGTRKRKRGGNKKKNKNKNKNKNRKNKNKNKNKRRRGELKEKNNRLGRELEVSESEDLPQTSEISNPELIDDTNTSMDNHNENDEVEKMDDELDELDERDENNDDNDTKEDEDEKIVGGNEATENEYPWIVGLFRKGQQVPVPYCGGSLIASQWVLTAVHCIRSNTGDTPASEISVLLGEHDLLDDTDGNVMILDVEQYFLHPNYEANSRGRLLADVALLKLATKADLATYTPVCLPSETAAASMYDGMTATAVGWGTLTAGGVQPPALQEVEVKVTTLVTCKTSYTGTGIDIVTGHICAADAGKDSCQGDSGGPLTVPTNNQHFQVGITSFGISCADARYPGVYADVANYRVWILCKMSENGGAEFVAS